MAGKGIYDWSPTATDNGTADASLTQAEGMAAGAVNNSSRQEMAREAAFIALLGGNTSLVTYGGAGNAYTVASPSGHAFTAFPTGLIFTFIPNATNSGAATLALDGMATKDIKLPNGDACPSGALVSGVAYLLRYTGAEFRIIAGALGSGASGVYQPASANLTEFATVDPSANGLSFVSAADYAAMRTLLGLVIGTNVQAYDADLTAWAGVAPSAAAQTGLPLVTTAGAALWDDADASAQRTTLGLGTAATVADSTLAHLAGTETFTGVKSARPSAAGARFYVGPDYNGGVAIEAGESALDIRAWTGAPTARLSRHNVNAWDIEVDGSGHLNFLDGGTAVFKMLTTNVLQVNGNTVYHAANLPGTAITWTANQAISFAYLDLSSSYDIRWGTQYIRGSTADYVRIGVTNNFFVTSTSGADLMTLDSAGGLQVGVALSTETGGTLTTASRNKQLRLASNPTIPASVFASDNMVMMRAMGTARTVTRGSGLAMYVNGVDVATCTLSARGTMVAIFDSATVCTLHGDVS